MRLAAVVGLGLVATSVVVPSAAAAAPVAEVHVEPFRSTTAIVYTARPGKVNDVTIGYPPDTRWRGVR